MKFKLDRTLFSGNIYLGVITREYSHNTYLIYHIIKSPTVRYTSRSITFKHYRLGIMYFTFPNTHLELTKNIFKTMLSTGIYNGYITAVRRNIQL